MSNNLDKRFSLDVKEKDHLDSMAPSATPTLAAARTRSPSPTRTSKPPSIRKQGNEKADSEKGDVTEEEVREENQTPVQDRYPHGFRLIVIIIAVCLAVFLVALDQTIVATAIPRITDQFQSVLDIGWYGSVSILHPPYNVEII
jgi:hypothetical protein